MTRAHGQCEIIEHGQRCTRPGNRRILGADPDDRWIEIGERRRHNTGCDGGLLSVRDLLDAKRVISPSRFGYLGSDMPAAPSSAAQAEAFTGLLDELAIDTVDVIAISAGTGAALQLALGHPDRVGRLVVSSGNLPGSPTAEAPPGWARAFYNDPTMWALGRFARPALSRMMGVPSGFPRDAGQEAVISEMLQSIFPVSPRAQGALFDANVSNPEVNSLDLGAIEVPVMLVHARDDPLASFDAARAASERIPGATLVALESGGHLQLGQTERVRTAIASFLTGSTPNRP